MLAVCMQGEGESLSFFLGQAALCIVLLRRFKILLGRWSGGSCIFSKRDKCILAFQFNHYKFDIFNESGPPIKGKYYLTLFSSPLPPLPPLHGANQFQLLSLATII